MTITVRRFKDDDGRIYEVGDRYDKDVSKDRLNTLTTKENKYKEVFIKKEEQRTPESTEEEDNPENEDYPIHTGGGYFELSNGEKVQGKEKAEEAEKALQE